MSVLMVIPSFISSCLVCGSYIPFCPTESCFFIDGDWCVALETTGYILYGERQSVFRSLDMISTLHTSSECDDPRYYVRTRYVYELSGAPEVNVENGIPTVIAYGKPQQAFVTVDTENLEEPIACNSPLKKNVEFDVTTNDCIVKRTGKSLFQSIKSFLNEAETRAFQFSWLANDTLVEDHTTFIARSGEWGCAGVTTEEPAQDPFDMIAWLKSPAGIAAVIVVIAVIVLALFMIFRKRPQPRKMPVVAPKPPVWRSVCSEWQLQTLFLFEMSYASQIDYSDKYYDATYEYR